MDPNLRDAAIRRAVRAILLMLLVLLACGGCTVRCSCAAFYCSDYDGDPVGCAKEHQECHYVYADACVPRARTGTEKECHPSCELIDRRCQIFNPVCGRTSPDSRFGTDGPVPPDESGCRSFDDQPRCEVRKIEGVWSCAIKPGQDPCGGCIDSPVGRCETTGSCAGFLCFKRVHYM